MVQKKQPLSKDLTLFNSIEDNIFTIRNKRVMLDSDLAAIYGVTTKRLNEQVKRNIERFPDEFMFHLTKEENNILKSQIATSKTIHGGRRTNPYVFTEHGAVMLASVLNSPVAVNASIYVVRAFVRFRELLYTHGDVKRKIDWLERKYSKHDQQIKAIFEAIHRLIDAPKKGNKKIGF